MENKKAVLLAAYYDGKTIQSKSSGEWKDFIPQNQVDFPNFDYRGIDNWRVKPVKERILEGTPEEIVQKARDYGDSLVNKTVEKEAQKRYPIDYSKGICERYGLNSVAHAGFIEGANWQKEVLKEEDLMMEVPMPVYPDKKETVEEAAKKYDGENAASAVKSFIAGAKWQAERMLTKTQAIYFAGYLMGKKMQDPKADVSDIFDEWEKNLKPICKE